MQVDNKFSNEVKQAANYLQTVKSLMLSNSSSLKTSQSAEDERIEKIVNISFDSMINPSNSYRYSTYHDDYYDYYINVDYLNNFDKDTSLFVADKHVNTDNTDNTDSSVVEGKCSIDNDTIMPLMDTVKEHYSSMNDTNVNNINEFLTSEFTHISDSTDFINEELDKYHWKFYSNEVKELVTPDNDPDYNIPLIKLGSSPKLASLINSAIIATVDKNLTSTKVFVNAFDYNEIMLASAELKAAGYTVNLFGNLANNAVDYIEIKHVEN